MACDNSGIHDRTAMSIFLYFIRKASAAAFTARLSLMSKSSHCSLKQGSTDKIYQVVNHLLEAYPTDDIIVKRNSQIACHIWPFNKSQLEFANDLSLKTFTCPPYAKYVLKVIFVERLPSS